MSENEWEMAHLVSAITKDNEAAAAARAEQAKAHASYRREFALEHSVRLQMALIAIQSFNADKFVVDEVLEVARKLEDYLKNG